MGGRGPQGFRGCSITIMVKWTNSGFVGPGGGVGLVRRGPMVVPSMQCPNGQIVVSWDLGGWGAVPQGSAGVLG